MDRPKSNPDISTLPTDEYNLCLRQTYDYFKHKSVRIPDGRQGTVIGVDPRPIRGGSDGNYLCVQVALRGPKPGQFPNENLYFMPNDLTLVGDTTTTS